MATRVQKTDGSKKSNVFVRFFRFIGNGIVKYFKPLGDALVHGDVFTKLSFLISGFGYFFHGQSQEIIGHQLGVDDNGHPDTFTVKSRKYVNQWLRGVFYLALEALAVLALVFWGIPNFKNLALQDIVPCYFDPDLMIDVCPSGGDVNSFMIVLFSVLTILILTFWFFIHLSSIKGVWKSEQDVKAGRPINSAKQDLKNLIDEHFYVTVLAVPVIGILAFTLVPTIMMILIAFTNYGDNVQYNAFTWVGGDNWSNLFGIGGGGSDFLTVFGNQLLWTLVWSFLATITCFAGGLLLALLLNSKRTKLTKVWRTGFVITIAVPQFVSLMLIRYFLADNGIVNNLLVYQWHLLEQPIPFLSDPSVMKVTIILVNCWVGFPYLMLMISGILMNIPADLYESASIDGAGKTRMFFSITMPYILQVCTPYLISSFVSNINNFNVIYLLTADYSPVAQAYVNMSAKESDLLITWLYHLIAESASHQYYMASIVGIIMFAISTVFTLIAFNLSQRGNREGSLQ